MVALLTSVRNSPCFGGLRRTKTCHRQLFARPSVFLRYFLHAAKSNKNRSLFGNFRGFTNLESTQPNNNFPLTKLNPLKTFTYFLLGTKSMTKKPLLTFLRKVRPCRDGTLRVLFAPPLAASPVGYADFFVACGNQPPPAVAFIGGFKAAAEHLIACAIRCSLSECSHQRPDA